MTEEKKPIALIIEVGNFRNYEAYLEQRGQSIVKKALAMFHTHRQAERQFLQEVIDSGELKKEDMLYHQSQSCITKMIEGTVEGVVERVFKKC
jgi:hypothetical protein